MQKTEKIEYHDGDVLLEGFYANDESVAGKKPAVLVVHDWSGRNEFACKKAEKLAELGYVGFALDMFGQNKLGQTNEEKTALIQPFMQDRIKLQKRILAALDTLKKLPSVDTNRLGAIGFCFGGLCALDLARSGASLRGVVSFHGLLMANEQLKPRPIQAKVLALHGFDDPMVPPDQVLAFQNEMTKAHVDWQMDIYGNTMHAFMNPAAHDPGFGTVYNPHVETRAWRAMEEFLNEVFR